MRADTDTGADVTARALARIEAALRNVDIPVGGWVEVEARHNQAVRADVPLLAAYALAGLALRREIEEQWGPGGDALAAYDAAIRAAGEAGQ